MKSKTTIHPMNTLKYNFNLVPTHYETSVTEMAKEGSIRRFELLEYAQQSGKVNCVIDFSQKRQQLLFSQSRLDIFVGNTLNYFTAVQNRPDHAFSSKSRSPLLKRNTYHLCSHPLFDFYKCSEDISALQSVHLFFI